VKWKTTALLVSGLTFAALLGLAGCSKSEKSNSSSGNGDAGNASADDQTAAKSKSINNLKQIGLALHMCHDALGKLPSAGKRESFKDENVDPLTLYSWRVQILPYIEQNALYIQILENKQRAIPDKAAKSEIVLYQNPLDPQKQPYKTHYRVFVGNGAAFEYGKGYSFHEFADGLTNTILVVEAADAVDWSKVDELNYDPKKPLPKLGIFEGGFHALMGDGQIRWIPAETDEKLIRAMITRNGGEKITLPGHYVR